MIDDFDTAIARIHRREFKRFLLVRLFATVALLSAAYLLWRLT